MTWGRVTKTIDVVVDLNAWPGKTLHSETLSRFAQWPKTCRISLGLQEASRSPSARTSSTLDHPFAPYMDNVAAAKSPTPTKLGFGD